MANENEIYELLNKKKQEKINADNKLVADSFDAQKQKKIAHVSRPGDVASNYEKPLMDKVIQGIGDPIYNALTKTKLGAAFTGFGEGEHQAIGSIAHLFNKNAMKPLNLDEDIDPELSGYRTAGKIAGNLAVDYGLLRGAGKTLRGATGIPGLTARVGTAAGIGYGTGEQFPEQLGGRAGAAALGALFPVTAGATAPEIGKNVIKAAENAEAKHGAEISAALAKANPIIKPKYTSALQKIMGSEIRIGSKTGIKDNLIEFFTNPSAQTAQNTMSTIKSAQRNMLSHTHPKVSTLPEGSQKIYYALGDAIKDLEKQVESAMPKEAFDMFKDALKKYAGKAGPYKQPAIEGARKGTGAAKNIPKAIAQMEKYSKTVPPEVGGDIMNQYQYLMKQHPELYINKYLPTAAKWGTTGIIANEGINYLKEIFNSRDNDHGGGEY